MKINKKISLLSLIITTLILTGCTANTTDNSPTTNTVGSITALDELFYDWEDISIEGGDVEHGFHFKNNSDSDLTLTGGVTSCMCTIVKFELPDGSLSPDFGMHNNEEKWSYTVKPGEEFEAEVIFDPMAHGPDAVGPIQRNITLFTSAGETELEVQSNVLYQEEYEEKYGDMDFVFEETEFDFGLLKQSSGIISYDFEFEYKGNDPIVITAVPASCACTKGKVSQTKFEKGDKGFLTVEFDPNLHEEPEGVFFKTASMLTEPKLEKQPEVKIWAEIDLDLGPEAYKLKEAHIN